MPHAKRKPELTSTVTVRHLPEQSDAAAGQHAFAYTVSIRNSGDVTAQLIARHWIITDANGHTEEVRGLAVVGQQPLLKPCETFEYTSWTRLATRHELGVFVEQGVEHAGHRAQSLFLTRKQFLGLFSVN